MASQPTAWVATRHVTPQRGNGVGVIKDLKLAPAKHALALATVSPHTLPRRVNHPANGDPYAQMRALLDHEEYDNFMAAATRLSSSKCSTGDRRPCLTSR